MVSADINARNSDLRWPSSLGFRLAFLLLLLLGVAGAAAFFGSAWFMGRGIEADIQSYEQAAAQSLAARIDGLTQRMEDAAGLLATLAMRNGGNFHAAALIEKQHLASQIIAVGIWPEPNSVDRARDRTSLYWIKNEKGQFVQRADYNDPRAVPYYREAWYTPARYIAAGHCYWSPAYQEPLARAEVVSCAMPMREGQQFLGVVTLSLSLAQLSSLLDEGVSGGRGYGLLIDGPGHPLAASGAAQALVKDSRTVAELAQKQSGFNPLALALHRRSQEQRTAAKDLPGVSGGDIIALKTATRDLSTNDADLLLGYLRVANAGRANLAPEPLQLPADPVIDGAASATLLQLPASGWQLARVQPANEGITGARRLFIQTMIMAGILAGGVLLMALILTNLAVLGPLRRVVRKLAAAGAGDDPLKLVLDESPRNELGALAFWINERNRQLRESVDKATAGQLQMSLEMKERRAVADQLVRFHERSQPALQAVSEAVIGVDEHNLVEDLNPAAEALLEMPLAGARGKPLAEVVNARSTTSELNAASTALRVIQRNQRLNPREPFTLSLASGHSRNIYLTALPMRARGANSANGAVLVLRGAEAAADPVAAPTAKSISGLPGREACEKRVAAVIAAARTLQRRSGLLVADLDHLRRINETLGRAAGDNAIAAMADALGAKLGPGGELYHLHSDRFALLMPGLEIQRAVAFAHSVREDIAHLRAGSGARSQGLTASFGIDAFGGESNAAEVLQRAEDACAAAKRGGGNTVRAYDASMPRAARDVDDAAWVRRVHAGLEQNMLQLTTQHVSPATPTAGAYFESLLALEDEEGFWSPATAFMPAAERHGLATAIDRWHINQVCAQLLQGDTLKRVQIVAVQISQSSIFDSQFQDFLIVLLEKHKQLAGRIALLMTESAVLAYPHQAQALADVLKAIGLPCGVSDFLGRDPAGLAILRQLPLDLLRVDARRFRNLAGDPAEQRLADAVLQLMRGLRKRSWIYGIEEGNQLEMWRRLGADFYQGGALAKATPVMFQQPRASPGQ